jgi:hypothetical protein
MVHGSKKTCHLSNKRQVFTLSLRFYSLMKIRSFIFIFVIALGLFPLFILVALNLPKTMERLQWAAEIETKARSHVGFTQLNARIQCLKKSLIRSATLPSTHAAVHDVQEIKTFSKVMERWFEKDDQVKGLMLIHADGKELLSLHRKDSKFISADFSENHKGHMFFNKALEVGQDQLLVKLVDQKTDPFHRTGNEEYELIMATPVMDSTLGTVGIMLMRVDMSEFLKNFMDSVWVTGDGSYVRGCKPELNDSSVSLENEDYN